jgi:dTDP-4-amino-4,6-dideoxygalactose transaminase
MSNHPITVPLLDLKAQYREIETEVGEAIRDVCASQHFILGPRVAELEDRVAKYSAAQYGIGMSSGTDALLAALMALDIGPGDEVLTTPFSFFATAGTVARLGARPVFCDIDPRTFNLSVERVTECLAKNYDTRDGALVNRQTGGVLKVLMPVHLFGQPADMTGLGELALRHRLRVIEDAAQAIGAECPDGRRAGSIGDIGCFSFFPSKNLGAFGDAGMCVTSDGALAERLRIVRAHGSQPKYHHAIVGGNFRLDELQAAVLLVKLRYLDDWTKGRQQNAALYDAAFAEAGLEGHVTLPHVVRGGRHIFNQYVIRAPRRDALRAALSAARVGTEIYYPVALHSQKCFADLGYQPGDCPESTRACAEVLALPIYPELTAEQQRHVVMTIQGFYADGH